MRRIQLAGDAVYAKVEHPARKGPTATDEFRNHLALRAAGLRAAEPWLALEGKAQDGRKARALVTREVRGAPLDEFLRTRIAGADARERASWARGIGRALRTLQPPRGSSIPTCTRTTSWSTAHAGGRRPVDKRYGSIIKSQGIKAE